jgi:hypothetical protein
LDGLVDWVEEKTEIKKPDSELGNFKS